MVKLSLRLSFFFPQIICVLPEYGKDLLFSDLWYQNELPECGSPQVRIRKKKIKEPKLLLVLTRKSFLWSLNMAQSL